MTGDALQFPHQQADVLGAPGRLKLHQLLDGTSIGDEGELPLTLVVADDADGLTKRIEEIRTGFERPFWVANVSEIFERLSYYAVFAALARYLHEALQFPASQAAKLSSIFGGAVWIMAVSLAGWVEVTGF